MNTSRIRIGLAIGFLGLALTTGTAAAQICTASVCDNQETVTTAATTPTTSGETLGAGETRAETVQAVPAGEGETVGAAAEAAPEGALPITGSDVVGLVLIGALAIGAGALLLRGSKTKTTA